MFVHDDPDTVLERLLKLNYKYMEYVLEINRGATRVRGVIQMTDGHRLSTMQKKICEETYPKPHECPWKFIFNSFEQAHSRNTILLQIQNGDRPEPGYRSDIHGSRVNEWRVNTPDPLLVIDDHDVPEEEIRNSIRKAVEAQSSK